MEEKRAQKNSPSKSVTSAENVRRPAGDPASVDYGTLSRAGLAELLQRIVTPQPIIINGDIQHFVLPQGQPQVQKSGSDIVHDSATGLYGLGTPTPNMSAGFMLNNIMYLLPGCRRNKRQSNKAIWANSQGLFSTTKTGTIQNQPFDWLYYLVWRKENDLPPLNIDERVPRDHLLNLTGNNLDSERFQGDWVNLPGGKRKHRYTLKDQINDLFEMNLIDLPSGKLTLTSAFQYEIFPYPALHGQIA